MKRVKKGAATHCSVCVNHEGRLLYKGAINELPVSETILIAKSIEFYSDPEPCFIHRSAVLARLYGEFEQWLGATYGASEEYNIELSEVPMHISKYFFNYDNIDANAK